MGEVNERYVFTRVPPRRRPFYMNRLFLCALLLLSALQTVLLLWPETHLVGWFGLAPPRPEDRRLRYCLLAVTAAHCGLALALEVGNWGTGGGRSELAVISVMAGSVLGDIQNSDSGSGLAM